MKAAFFYVDDKCNLYYNKRTVCSNERLQFVFLVRGREAEGVGYKRNGGVGLKEGKVVWERME